MRGGAVLGGRYDDLRDAELEVAYLEGCWPASAEAWRTVTLALLDLAKRQDAEQGGELEALKDQVEVDEEALEDLREQLSEAEADAKRYLDKALEAEGHAAFLCAQIEDLRDKMAGL